MDAVFAVHENAHGLYEAVLAFEEGLPAGAAGVDRFFKEFTIHHGTYSQDLDGGLRVIGVGGEHGHPLGA